MYVFHLIDTSVSDTSLSTYSCISNKTQTLSNSTGLKVCSMTFVEVEYICLIF